jgi:hypothetical protein
MDFGFPSEVTTLVVCPSISFPAAELAKITGVERYEEWLLFVLLGLAEPGLRIVYLTSLPIDDAVIRYYLEFLHDPDDARRRLHLIDLGDGEPRALSAKLLERSDIVEEIRSCVDDPATAYVLPFNVSPWEGALAETLGLPLYGPPPGLTPLGSKSGARRLARAAGVDVLDGAEDLWSVREAEREVSELLRRRPRAEAVVIKLNNGFSGQGNAILDVHGIRSPIDSSDTVFCAQEESWPSFGRKIVAEGAVVEELVRAPGTTSPSVQVRVRPGGVFDVVSTHDQILGGPDDQVYLGCRFPARPEYRALIQDLGTKMAAELVGRGVIGSFGMDFLVVSSAGGWRAYLTEINLRMGGTTHPFEMARLVTGGHYDAATGDLVAKGRAKHYIASDNLKSDSYIGLEPEAVIDAIDRAGIAFDPARATGVTLHLLGALEAYGKLGAVCIEDSPQAAEDLYRLVVDALDGLVRSSVA